MTVGAGEVIVVGIACGMVAVGLAVAALVIVVRGEHRRTAARAAGGSRSRFLRAGRAAASYLLTTSTQRGRSAPSRPSGAASAPGVAGGRSHARSGTGRSSGGSGLYSVGGLHVGQRVTPTEAIHTSRGTAWPGTLGVIVHIGGGGQLADSFTVRFPGFVARGVYLHQIHAA
jgi:hypothetical protein